MILILEGQEKIIEICKKLGADHYINPIGGIELYSKKKFESEHIKLNFIKMENVKHHQGEYDFIDNLSILDVLVCNTPQEVSKFLKKYKLV
jgi:hypothetical protein